MKLDDVQEKVIEASLEAGRYLIAEIESTQAEAKGANDLVTRADRGSEKILIDRLSKILPEAAILSEEIGFVGNNAQWDYVWVIDPLDGTVNYSFQIPFYAVSVALLHNHEPVLGVIYAPALNEFFAAYQGGGATLNGKALDLRQSGERLLHMVATSAGMTRSDFSDNVTSYHAQVLPHFNRLRLMGSQALHLSYVAAGRIEVALTNEARLWDDAAGSLILQEANGIYCGLGGERIFPLDQDSQLYAGNPYFSIGASSAANASRIIEYLDANGNTLKLGDK